MNTIESIIKNGIKNGEICCFCYAPITDGGNNPFPANKDEGARCCDYCNTMRVIPARLRQLGIG